mgnify:CR=1 FL=1
MSARLQILQAGALILLSFASISPTSAAGDARRGAYLAKAGGCVGCHTEDKRSAAPFAGGRALKTPFGTFFGPNITPHLQAGIGRWSEADFARAMRHGRRPDGANYFPAFPYPSYTLISDADLRDLWAYLRTLPPNNRANRPHDLRFPYGWRFLVTAWKWLYFTPGPFASAPGPQPVVVRGAYLVQALGHCGECHTPRNFLGGPIRTRFLAGTRDAPNLTPARLKDLSDEELREVLVTGITPNDGPVAEAMDEVVRNTTSQLTPGDLTALIAYLRAVPPLPKEPR